jgi:glycosyltransferase involved in cell wall biosynthesis
MAVNQPLVSIGLPVYNGEQFVALAIESLLAQTYGNLELVICDNASTDRTGEICRHYAQEDSRVRYFRNDVNLGAAANYNRTFHEVRGTYFRWAADDDLCARELIARYVEVLEERPSVVLAYSRSIEIDATGSFLTNNPSGLNVDAPRPSERFEVVMQRHEMLCMPVFGLMRREQLARTPLIGNYVASDHVLLAELSLMGHFFEVPEYLFLHRQHPVESARCFRGRHYDRIEFFDPKKDAAISLVEWRRMAEYWKLLARAKLSLRERMHCTRSLLRWWRWKFRGVLGRDLRRVSVEVFRRATFRRPPKVSEPSAMQQAPIAPPPTVDLEGLLPAPGHVQDLITQALSASQACAPRKVPEAVA